MKKLIIGFSLIAIIFLSPAAELFLGLVGENEQPKNIEVFLLFTIFFTLSAAGLWVWMVLDYKTNKKSINHRALWGWGLFIANWVAAIVYFIVIYFPREKRPPCFTGRSKRG
jgi:Na+-driven multidrug efflux pump